MGLLVSVQSRKKQQSIKEGCDGVLGVQIRHNARFIVFGLIFMKMNWFQYLRLHREIKEILCILYQKQKQNNIQSVIQFT